MMMTQWDGVIIWFLTLAVAYFWGNSRGHSRAMKHISSLADTIKKGLLEHVNEKG